MIKNLYDYFLPSQEFYLDKIIYNRMETNNKNTKFILKCIDKIDVSMDGDFVKITVERDLEFEPVDILKLSVSFGEILKFDEIKKQEYNWNELDLKEEFRENGGFVIDNLIKRITLLIAEITSSFGQAPIIVPPEIAKKTKVNA